VPSHELPDLRLGLRPDATPSTHLANKMTIAQGLITEARRGHLVLSEKGLDFREERFHTHIHRCVKPHRQGVFHNIYRECLPSCDRSHMAEPTEVDRVKDALRRLMEARGIKAKPLAKKAGLGETFVRDMFDREGGDVKLGTLHKLAGALDVTLDDLLGSAAVQVVGRVGAGGSVIFEEVRDGLVPRPPGMGGSLEALEVDGSSMLPRYSAGDVVYIARTQDGVFSEDVGEFCAVRLTTGETYIKQLAIGSRPGFYTLRSLNAEDIIDVELEWATPIIFVLPRAARRRLGI
jgi:DNA-binding Xre family transcriptional regulator